jgi:hypothetical protein
MEWRGTEPVDLGVKNLISFAIIRAIRNRVHAAIASAHACMQLTPYGPLQADLRPPY